MKIKEHHPLDLRDKTDKSNKKREDILHYHHIDKHVATLVIPTMILTIIGDKQYKVKDKEEVCQLIKEHYFNNKVKYEFTKEDVIGLCHRAFSLGAMYQHEYTLRGKKPDSDKVINDLIEFYT